MSAVDWLTKLLLNLHFISKDEQSFLLPRAMRREKAQHDLLGQGKKRQGHLQLEQPGCWPRRGRLGSGMGLT
jgi:hypothetical protein